MVQCLVVVRELEEREREGCGWLGGKNFNTSGEWKNEMSVVVDTNESNKVKKCREALRAKANSINV
jgi:hypothetical protein